MIKYNERDFSINKIWDQPYDGVSLKKISVCQLYAQQCPFAQRTPNKTAIFRIIAIPFALGGCALEAFKILGYSIEIAHLNARLMISAIIMFALRIIHIPAVKYLSVDMMNRAYARGNVFQIPYQKT